MYTIRPVRWPDDSDELMALDTSFVTDRVYRLERDDLSFALVEQAVEPPIQRRFAVRVEELPRMDFMVLAEVAGRPVGFAAAKYEDWNRRLAIWHLYIALEYRGQGIGRALVNELSTFARSAGARCLWTETLLTNYPAIQFYRRTGFRLCGLDDSVYDPLGVAQGEIAVYFTREVDLAEAR